MAISKKTKLELKNLAFHFFRDELAYESYIIAMEQIFANEVLKE